MLVISSISRDVVKIVQMLPAPIDLFIFEMYNRLLRAVTKKGNLYLANTYYGANFSCDIFDAIQRRIFYFGIWEPIISRVTQELLQEGDVYIDIGANIGYDSLLAAKCVGESGKIVAIEASPKIYAMLDSNINQNGIRNVRYVNLAVSDARGTLTLYSGDDTNIGAATTVSSRGMKEECKVIALPLDEILLTDELSRAKLLKIDIEGAEVPVLNNIMDNIFKYSQDFSIIVEASLQEDQAGWTRVISRFQEVGFNAYEIDNEYDISSYLRKLHYTQLKPLESLPNCQIDILLTRGSLPAALRVSDKP